MIYATPIGKTPSGIRYHMNIEHGDFTHETPYPKWKVTARPARGQRVGTNPIVASFSYFWTAEMIRAVMHAKVCRVLDNRKA